MVSSREPLEKASCYLGVQIVIVRASINAHAWPGSGMRRKVDSLGGDFSSVLLGIYKLIKLCIALRQ